MIITLVYDGARYLAVCVLYTVNRMAEATIAAIPMPKRTDNAHLRVLLACSFHIGGKGRSITTRSTTMLEGRCQLERSNIWSLARWWVTLLNP